MNAKVTPEPEMRITLTDEQRQALVKFISNTNRASLNVEVEFEAHVDQGAIAPVAVLVGNAY
ncbi:hypothetical protein [Actinoplanes sp. NBRC 103695]|uniref:hypothetical protein n=1 Tax=Actinoplanes sp. NBRC 103695 TaxID=3032202 RepID=UPI0024A58626|nr:hypothetical protein [Actinoplanes sp. NBRC 103695]GLY99625.1 hypothetical protein Acsp02_68780 [Actinoplanes sp. NBRC 103695]